jgi:hypothetical protein
MQPQPPNPDDDAARAAARQEYIEICNANSQHLARRIMHYGRNIK